MLHIAENKGPQHGAGQSKEQGHGVQRWGGADTANSKESGEKTLGAQNAKTKGRETKMVGDGPCEQQGKR